MKDANSTAKSTRGSVAITLTREHANVLLMMLDIMLKADPDNEDADKLKRKIITYGRTYNSKGDDKVVIYFYEQEASALIALMIYYIGATDEPQDDYFFSIGKRYKR